MSDARLLNPAQDAADDHNVAAREPVRSQLAADVEAFLARGGAINEVPRNLRADPPRLSDSRYGRGAI